MVEGGGLLNRYTGLKPVSRVRIPPSPPPFCHIFTAIGILVQYDGNLIPADHDLLRNRLDDGSFRFRVKVGPVLVQVLYLGSNLFGRKIVNLQKINLGLDLGQV